MNEETRIRDILECPAETFRDYIRHVPPVQQDALRTASYLEMALANVVRVRARDVDDRGIAVRGRIHEWPTENADQIQLRDRLLSLVARARPAERLFEPHRPIAVADDAMERLFRLAVRRHRESLALREREVDARLPSFLVLGAPKCATTWLYHCLVSHPEVYVPAEKELEFFGNYRYHQGMNWYKQYFTDWSDEPVGGDVSVFYLNRPEAPRQIREHLDPSSTKLIMVLREPIDRALSFYHDRLVSGHPVPTFERTLESWYYRDLYIETGHYIRYYKRYTDLFPQENILVLLYEDIREDAGRALSKVLEFLGVNPAFESSTVRTRSNVGRQIRSLPIHNLLSQAALRAGARIPRHGRRIRQVLRQVDRTINMKSRTGPYRIRADAYERLREEFAPSNEALAQETGLDLGVWERAGGVVTR